MDGLTKRQREILQEIGRFIGSKGYPPSIRDLAGRFSMAPPSMLAHVRALEQKGAIRRTPGRSRTIEVVGRPAGPVGHRHALLAVPILGRIAAGTPILAEEHGEGTVLLDPARAGGGELFALRVKGESMTGAGILPGDIVVVRRQSEAQNGDLVIAMVGDEATVKRLRIREGRVEFHPENPFFDPIVPDPRETAILGKVVEVRRTIG